jgi:hypothetical protein
MAMKSTTSITVNKRPAASRADMTNVSNGTFMAPKVTSNPDFEMPTTIEVNRRRRKVQSSICSKA